MHYRRIVTGQRNGRAVVMTDENVAPITVSLIPGGEFHRIGGSDAAPNLSGAATVAAPVAWFPPASGHRFAFVTIPPEGPPPAALDLDAALAELETKLPGMARVLEPEAPGMHTTDTIDFGVVISGRVYLELDDGVEVLLNSGDSVVQTGTRHRWRNRGAVPCVMAVAMIGATRSR